MSYQPDSEEIALDVRNRHWSQVETGAPGAWLWSNAICAFSPAGMVPAPTQTRTAPVPIAGEETAQIVALHAFTPPGAMLISQMLPVRVSHAKGGPIMARAIEVTPQSARIALWPNAEAFEPRGATFTITPGNSAEARLQLFSSPAGYQFAPNSRHKVTISTLALPADAPPPAPVQPPKGKRDVKPKAPPKTPPKGKAPQTPAQPATPPKPDLPAPISQEVVADAQGSLTIDCTGAALMVEIVPINPEG